jgi:M6 family metalloprotease-like protein
VVYLRDGKETTVDVKLGTAPGQKRGFGAGNQGEGGNWDTRTRQTFQKPVFRLAVIPISYTDVPPSTKITPKDWENALFSKGTFTDKNATGRTVYGSMHDYYYEQSCGKLSVEGKCFTSVKLNKKRMDYSDAQRNSLYTETLDALLARDGANALKDYDGIFFLYAGNTATSQRGNLYWPHQSTLQYKGERWRYFISPEGADSMATISTSCHEFGHMLGLPDLYAKPEVPGMEGVGAWCAMSNQVGTGRPQHFGAWSKEQMKWVTPTIIDPKVPQKIILAPIEGTTNQMIKVLVRPDGSEYFLLEVRKKIGFDKSVPAEGLLIWRVVDGRPILEESHGIAGPAGPRRYLESVPFPSRANTAFTPYTIPSSDSIKGSATPVFITNIRRLADGRVAFQIGYEFY